MFVLSTCSYTSAECCHYLSATLHLTPGGCSCLRACEHACVYVCVCAPWPAFLSCVNFEIGLCWETFSLYQSALFTFLTFLTHLVDVACMNACMLACGWGAASRLLKLYTTKDIQAARSHTPCFTQLIPALLRELISRVLIPVRLLAGCVNQRGCATQARPGWATVCSYWLNFEIGSVMWSLLLWETKPEQPLAPKPSSFLLWHRVCEALRK